MMCVIRFAYATNIMTTQGDINILTIPVLMADGNYYSVQLQISQPYVTLISATETYLPPEYNDFGQIAVYETVAGIGRIPNVQIGNHSYNITLIKSESQNNTFQIVEMNLSKDVNPIASNVPTNTGIDYSNWMFNLIQENPALNFQTLQQFVITGSHDAGMYDVFSGQCTAAANSSNTQTQRSSIKKQLEAGSRYFDIRPVINIGWGSSDMYVGHYSKVGPVYEGCPNAKMDDILSQVKSFIENSNDLVVLNFSHYLDYGGTLGTAKEHFSGTQFQQLVNKVTNTLGTWLYTGPIPATAGKLTDVPLNAFIGNDGGKILVIFSENNGEDFVSNPSQGLYSSTDFPLYDKYSGTSDVKSMSNDQIETKLKDSANHINQLFLLSWTLTQSDSQAAVSSCLLGIAWCVAAKGAGMTILGLANKANTELQPALQKLYNDQPVSYIPNIIYVDDYSHTITDQATTINRQLASGSIHIPNTPASYIVTNSNDSGDGSLRQAITNANQSNKALIIFDDDYVITLDNTLTISSSLTIDGTDNTIIISGNKRVPVFQVNAPAQDVSFENLIISNGYSNNPNSMAGGITVDEAHTVTIEHSTITGNTGSMGGGILSRAGNLTIDNSTISNNATDNYGGGIYMLGSTLNVNNSTFFNNLSNGYQGGAISSSGTTTTINNSTFVKNFASAEGGAILAASGEFTIANSTIAGNSVGNYFNVVFNSGGGISVSRLVRSLILKNNIIAANFVLAQGYPFSNCSTYDVSYGGNVNITNINNLIGLGNDCGNPIISTDDPMFISSLNEFDPLQDNGGATKTLALHPESPAIDAGDNATCLPTDQRGISRPQGDTCDIGAFELQK